MRTHLVKLRSNGLSIGYKFWYKACILWMYLAYRPEMRKSKFDLDGISAENVKHGRNATRHFARRVNEIVRIAALQRGRNQEYENDQ